MTCPKCGEPCQECERRRRQAADRQARFKAKNKVGNVTCNVTANVTCSKNGTVLAKATALAKKVDFDEEGVMDWWNNDVSLELKCPKIEKLTKLRLKKLKDRLKDFPNYFERIAEESSRAVFTHGQTWMSFDWLLNETNVQKFLEGNYQSDGPRRKNGMA